jgi:hypothetical protein
MSIFKRRSISGVPAAPGADDVFDVAIGRYLLSLLAILVVIGAVLLESAARLIGIAVLLAFVLVLFTIAIWGPFSVTIERHSRRALARDSEDEDDAQLVLIR